KRAGVQVAFFVKPKHVEACARGFALHRHRILRAPLTERFMPDEVLSDIAAVEAERWDLVLLCVATSALEGLLSLLEKVGDATVVTLQPGIHARALLEPVVPASHLVTGTIAFIAYEAPLEGEGLAPGTAAFFP